MPVSREDAQNAKTRASKKAQEQPSPGANGADTNGPEPAAPEVGFSDVELIDGEPAEPTFIVDNLVPEGSIILAGRPKTGKTTLAMNLADAKARGGMALGNIQCEQGDVLFLALEDNRRRLRKRRRMMLDAEGLRPTERLTFKLEWPRLDDGGIEKLDAACARNPNLKLIVIDTWKKICPRRRKDQDDYDHQSDAATLLQKLAAKYQIAIIIIHHSRKGPGSEDFVDDVLGTTGLTGAVDTIISFKRKRGTSDAEIAVTGRDVDECEKALAGDQTTGLWRLLDGNAADHRHSRQRKAILDLLKDGKVRRVKDIADLLGEHYDATRKTCARMADDGHLSKIGTGYTVPQNVL
jgi:hypothetical protein